MKHIKELLKLGLTANKTILKSITRNNLPQITKAQLNSLKSRIKQAKFGPSNSCLHEVVEWCKTKSEVPEDDDEVFCGGCEYHLNDTDEITFLRIFVTTKRLISLTKYG